MDTDSDTDTDPTTPEALESVLIDILENGQDFDIAFGEIGHFPEDCTAFGEAGLLTSNKGLVILMDDGSEFQVTIVQSRLARSERD